MKRAHIEKALKKNSACMARVEESLVELEEQRRKLLRMRGKFVLKADNAGYTVKGDNVLSEVLT